MSYSLSVVEAVFLLDGGQEGQVRVCFVCGFVCVCVCACVVCSVFLFESSGMRATSASAHTRVRVCTCTSAGNRTSLLVFTALHTRMSHDTQKSTIHRALES